MDPVVRVALTAQQLIAKSLGLLSAVAFGAVLVLAAPELEPSALNLLLAGAFLVSLVVRAVRRLRRIAPGYTARLDLELFTHLMVLAYAGVLATPGHLDGASQPVVYALMMLGAAFCRPLAALGTFAFAVGLDAALSLGPLHRSPDAVLGEAGFLAGFGVLNLLVFRAELARVRRLSRQRVHGELQRLRDDARSYRLLGAPASAVDAGLASSPSAAPSVDPDRLLRSSVDEIHHALTFALELLRQALGLRSAVLLWLDDTGKHLYAREISTDLEEVTRGPFSSAEGLYAAALESRRPMPLTGRQCMRHVPYYAFPPAVGAVCAVPVVDHGTARGVLAVDRGDDAPFSERQLERLEAATRFILRVIENERVFVQLDRAKIEQGKLYRAVDQLAAATTEAGVIEAGVNSAREFAAFDFAVVTLFKRGRGVHEICAASGDGTEDLVGQSFRHNAGLVSMAVTNRHPLPYRGDYDPERQIVFTRHVRPPEVPSLVVLPLLVHDTALGTLVLGSRERRAFGVAVRPTLEVLSRHIAVSLANARMVKRLGELATTDGMTGHLNKRALIETAKQKLRSAERFRKPLAVLVCDIDHFKKVNDGFGHDVGDVVIKGFGTVLTRNKRETDCVGRFGGEEFVLVCEETDAEGALLLAERIRRDLEATTFHSEQGPVKVTCSVGVAMYPDAGKDWDTLFKSTDDALYTSKRGGRNRVTCWNPKLKGASQNEAA